MYLKYKEIKLWHTRDLSTLHHIQNFAHSPPDFLILLCDPSFLSHNLWSQFIGNHWPARQLSWGWSSGLGRVWAGGWWPRTFLWLTDSLLVWSQEEPVSERSFRLKGSTHFFFFFLKPIDKVKDLELVSVGKVVIVGKVDSHCKFASVKKLW